MTLHIALHEAEPGAEVGLSINSPSALQCGASSRKPPSTKNSTIFPKFPVAGGEIFKHEPVRDILYKRQHLLSTEFRLFLS